MGDRIAQLIFEKLKIPIVKEMNELEGTDRGVGGYGSTGIKGVIGHRVGHWPMETLFPGSTPHSYTD